MKLPQLNEGETYIGLIGNATGEAHHVILLPGDNDEANYEAALEWAKSIGGDLPTRIEQAMMWENHKGLFQEDWYWSNETYSADPAYAWCQNFYNGYQSNGRKHYELRARAVRRASIGELE
jgi:hypothetical protein